MKRKVTNLPIVVPKASTWCDTVPSRVIDAIIKQREEQLREGTFEEFATDAEVLLFLYCASMVAPLDDDYVEIYVYVLNKVAPLWGVEIPRNLKRETLPQYLQEELKKLKREIRRKSLKRK